MPEFATCHRCKRYLDVTYLEDAPHGTRQCKDRMKPSCDRISGHREKFTRFITKDAKPGEP